MICTEIRLISSLSYWQPPLQMRIDANTRVMYGNNVHEVKSVSPSRASHNRFIRRMYVY